MSTISVQDLQRDLLAFLRRVETGESFLIISGKHPLAEGSVKREGIVSFNVTASLRSCGKVTRA